MDVEIKTDYGINLALVLALGRATTAYAATFGNSLNGASTVEILKLSIMVRLGITVAQDIECLV